MRKINKIHRPLAKLTKRQKKIQINKIRGEIGTITKDTEKIQRIRRTYLKKNLYFAKNIDKMDTFIDIDGRDVELEINQKLLPY